MTVDGPGGTRMGFGWKAHVAAGVPWLRPTSVSQVNLKQFMLQHPASKVRVLTWLKENNSATDILNELRWCGAAGDFSACFYKDEDGEDFHREIFASNKSGLKSHIEFALKHGTHRLIELWRRDAKADDWNLLQNWTWPKSARVTLSASDGWGQ